MYSLLEWCESRRSVLTIALSPFFVIIRKVWETQEGVKLIESRLLLVYAEISLSIYRNGVYYMGIKTSPAFLYKEIVRG
jgi:hypothetical protein